MLRILIVSGILIFYPLAALGQNRFLDRKVSFFENSNKSLNLEKKCESCNQEAIREPMLNRANSNFVIENNKLKNQTIIKLFIDPNCKYAQSALDNVLRLSKEISRWSFEVYMLGSKDDFRSFVFLNKDFMKSEITINYATDNTDVLNYGITETPTYIIEAQNKIYKISGQPNLMDIVGNL